MDRTIGYFEALGDLETVLGKLKDQKLAGLAKEIQTVMDAALDRALESGSDSALDQLLGKLPRSVLKKSKLHTTASGKTVLSCVTPYRKSNGTISNLYRVVSKTTKTRNTNNG